MHKFLDEDYNIIMYKVKEMIKYLILILMKESSVHFVGSLDLLGELIRTIHKLCRSYLRVGVAIERKIHYDSGSLILHVT